MARPTAADRGLLALGTAGALLWLAHTRGATRAERRCALPGDDLLGDAQVVITRATTVGAPAERIWPWLAQVGWHRGGWYTAPWVDRLLFPANRPSATEILPQHQDIAVGDFVPDGPPETECGFVVAEVRQGRHLVLRSTTHLPLTWRRTGIAAVDWTWSFVLRPTGAGQTRFVFRWRLRGEPWWLVAGCRAFVVPADVLMSRSMLRGIRVRAETWLPWNG